MLKGVIVFGEGDGGPKGNREICIFSASFRFVATLNKKRGHGFRAA